MNVIDSGCWLSWQARFVEELGRAPFFIRKIDDGKEEFVPIPFVFCQ
jgi:hypothetical protein